MPAECRGGPRTYPRDSVDLPPTPRARPGASLPAPFLHWRALPPFSGRRPSKKEATPRVPGITCINPPLRGARPRAFACMEN
eukprot:gene10839-biopygen19832